LIWDSTPHAWKKMRGGLINFVLRIVKRRLSSCRTPGDVRKAFNGFPSLSPRGVHFSQGNFGGVSGEWAEPNDERAIVGTVLYLHGGGYVAMSPRTHRSITGALALRGFTVFAPAYRLAPEHIFPAALNDVTETYLALRAEVDGPIFLAGDSSGAGLAVSLLVNLRDRGEERPSGACLFSPWIDLAVTGDSVVSNRDRDPMEVPETLLMLAEAYIGKADPRKPLISPIYGNLAGLPPLLIFAGDTEILLDDAKRLAERARVAGVAADMRVYPNMPHAWPLLNVVLPEGRRALDEAASFMQSTALRRLVPVSRSPIVEIRKTGT
jgi:acetyl esterase/lipase